MFAWPIHEASWLSLATDWWKEHPSVSAYLLPSSPPLPLSLWIEKERGDREEEDMWRGRELRQSIGE